MKNFLHFVALAICTIFTVTNASAQVITAERASEIANKFFANGKQKSAAFRSTNATLTQSIDSRAVTGESNDAPTFHILTGADGKGFVIVSGEETENPIIGYSLDGTIDTNNLPDGFVGYMSDIDAQVRALREYNAANPQKAAARSAMQKAADFDYNATTMGNIVKNLNTAPWGQHGPFNNLCKTTDGQTALTGCGPTAFAILCYYYKWPASGVGTVTHQGTGENMELGHAYDYENMRNDDYRSGYTEVEANAVAVLMRDLGWANQVGYGTGSTSFSETGQHMVDHFRFKSERPVDHGTSLAVVRSTLGNDAQWKTYIKNCLDAGYPIPYASTTNTSNSARHIYILDGYTDNDYYHFNWGWSGQGNGWFTLDNMVPDDYSNYSNSHKAYFNLIPDATTYTVTATVNNSNMGTVSINGGTAGSEATANLMQGVTATLTAHPAQGYALASWTKNGVVVGSRNTIQVTVGTDANDYIANFDDEANVLVVKEYTVNPANGSLSGGTSKYSTWTSTDTQPALTLKATNASGAAVYAISALSSSYKAYATAYDSSDKAHTNITYTLSVPEGYVITNYLMTYNVGTAGQISLNGELLNTTGDHTLSAAPNAQTASFTLSVPSAGQQYITVKSIAVTVQSEGGGSTPTPDPEPEPEPDPTPVTYAITTTANPADGGTAKFAVGTGNQQTQGDVENGTQITLYATANTGYTFVNWTLGGNVVSTDATCNVNVSQAANYVANFEENATPTPTEYPTPTGATYQNNYLTSVTTTGANENISYTANTHPNKTLVTLPGTVRVEQGKSFTLNLVAKSLSSSTSSVYEDMRYCHASLFTDFDGNRTFGAAVQTWGNQPPTNNVAGNYSSVMNITHEITVPADAPLGTSHVRMIYTNAWKGWPTNGTAELDKGIVYDIVVEVVEPSNEKTLDVTFNNATYTKTDGTELTSGWGYQVVTQTTPAVTIKVAETINNFGYTTGVISGVKTPYLYKNTNFILSISEQYKITGYRITVRGQDNSYSGDFTCSVDGNETSKATLSGTTTQTLSATGLDTNIINISVGGTSGNGIFITALEITYVENEFTPLPFKAEIDGWRNNNPNTHLGTITIGGTAMKLTPEHLNASELTMPVVEGTTLAFTRKYRGFEFQGFYIGSTSLGENPTLTAEHVAAINETTPLVAKFTATDDVTLFYDDDEFSYRIPAIVKTVKDDKHKLIAISDYRHSFDDIGRDNHKTGTTQVDLVIRTSEDNGATWTAKQTIAEGSQHFGYGDAAAVANGQDVLVMAVAGNVFYAYADSENPQQAYRIYSNDNGVTWEKEDISSNMESLFPDYHGLFFGSGKLAVDPDFNGSGNARVYGAILMKDSQGERNYVLYSDNWGKTWNILGNAVAARQNEPKVEILPNGQILLSARRGGGRTFNVFTYTDKANNAGTWNTATNGCDNGGNSTNGEIICLDAKKPNGKPTKILLQSQPYGSDRRNVSIWYKEIDANETYTASSIASDWTMGKQASTQLSAYSAMCLQENGEIALFFEEAPCYGDDHTKGYSMVYVPLTIEEITGENFLNPDAVVETVTVDVTLTDAQGNTYTHQFDYLPGDAAAIDAALTTAYPFITMGAEGNLQGSDNYYTYTNTVTLPFKVSNANTTVWHNIYWPANDTSAGKYYPIYLLSTAEGDTYVAKKTETKHYGESSYNTLNWADELSWAVYSVDGTLNFKFKNKLTGKFMAVNGVVSTGSTNNVIYTDEANATTFTLEKYTGTNTYYGNYAIKSVYNGTTGYVCNTSVGHANATNYTGTDHAGAWAKFVEAPDYKAIVDALTENVAKFGEGNGNYTDNNDINAIKAIIENIANTPLNTLNTHTETVQNVKDSYREVVLTVNDAETATVPGTISITVNGSAAETVNNKFVPANATVSILATANPGYRFVNWTRPAAQASAAARTAEARNSDVVSDQNPYTVTVSEALSLEANFEQIVVNATLTDAQGNTYNVQLDGFTTEITEGTVAAKLTEKYPYITLGDNATLDKAAYTYSNNVTLPFKVSSVSDATKTYWHNIYYPSNNKTHSGYPNYIAAFNDEDDIVDMAESPDYAYGDNPTYNTKAGNPMISWVVYSVNNSFEFVFKNELTNKYIKVESVVNATGNTQNVKFVENAGDATAFTLLKDAGSYNGDYALVATVDEAEGYLCATSSSTNFVTHFDRMDHQGAWVKFEEVDYGQYINVLDTKLRKFDVGNDKHMITDEIQPMINALVDNFGVNITKSQFEAYFEAIDAMDAENWPKLSLTIAPDNSGTTTIAGEEGVTRKYVPTGNLIINATPAEGYHFVSWTSGTNEVSTEANYEFNITAATELTANFAKNSYTVNVSTNGTGGSAMIGTETSTTVEHGDEVTLTAVANNGYEFAGWYNGEVLVSAEATYTFTVTSDINYTARFNEVSTGTVAIHITVASTDGTTVTNAVDGNVKAIINSIGQEWATEADFVVGADVELVASSDYDQKAYLFDGWYKNDELVSKELEITVKATEAATYQARFFRGCVVIGEPKSNRIGYVTKITLPDGTSLGYDASNRAVVKEGTEVMINTWLSYGYETIWKDEHDNIVGNEQNLVITIEKDVTYTATFEPASYELTVRANDDSYGTVSATSGTSTGTNIKVGHNMEATITATAKTGYYFVNWTKGTDVVSSENPYTIPGIANIEDMDDVEYIANFLPVENATAGTYYRIAYDYTAPAAAGAARTGATRAAGEQTITLLTTGELGGIKSNSKNSEWNSDYLSMHATGGDGSNPVYAIYKSGTSYFRLFGYTNDANSNTYNKIKYTLSAKEGYVITSCSFSYTQKIAGAVTITYNGASENSNDASSHDWAITPNAQTVEITLSTTTNNSSNYLTVKNFTVTIQPVGGEGGGETPEPEPEPGTPTVERYYMQSVASGVTSKANALKMTQETGAASIFYYADSKLLSYDKGTYIKEDGGTRGLQEVGASGTVTITTTGETSTIAAPSYMHAVINKNGTSYVDHCGSNNGDVQHNFVLEEVTTLPVTISSALHATFYAPVAVEIPEGVRAYVLKEKNITANSWVTMTMLQNGIIPANTGVILKSEEAKTYYFEITENTDEARAEAVGNILEGTVAKSYVNKDAYILTKKSNGVGMYPLSNNSYITGGTTATFTNNSHKAYLPVEGNFAQLLQQGVGFRFIFDDETTEIENVKGIETENTIYDLQGRKLIEITEPGIYIVNGKKIFVK